MCLGFITALFQVIDKSHTVGEFTDVSKVEKFELGEEDYSKRTGNICSFYIDLCSVSFNAILQV